MSQVYVENSGNKDSFKTTIVLVLLLIYALVIFYVSVFHPEYFSTHK